MKVAENIADIRKTVRQYRQNGSTVGFVPTMGALHEGHLSLIRLAKKRADEVVVSIYVNPEQFAPDEDFGEYPRTLDADLKKCETLGVSTVFTPSDEIMYAEKQFFSIGVGQLNDHMDGGSRPGFFEGILLVVNKFFNIIEPDVALFGQKDVQQFRILQQMAKEFNHNVELIMAPIVRADDGLALSSRNTYLDDQQRAIAPGLYRGLRYVKKQIDEGASNIRLMLKHQKEELKAKGLKIDYFNLYAFDTVAPVDKLNKGKKYILAGAVYLGETRLIDNMIIEI